MYYKNIKGNGKIVNHYQLLKNYIYIYVSKLWFVTYHTYLHTNSLFNAGFY